MIELNKIHCGDCQTAMQEIDSDSVDCIVTDPPYGLSFMGKDWDKAVPSIAIWQECLRVLKPGAFAFVMCIPRQDCLARMICRLEDAEFNVAFSSIYWTYASGFPKALNLSKAVDKQYGRIGCDLSIIKNKLRKLYTESGKTMTQIDNECGFRATGYLRTKHREDDGWGEALPTERKWEIIKRVIGCKEDISKEIAEYFKEAEREITGKGKAGFFERNLSFEADNKGYGDYDVTKSKTLEGKALDGAYSGCQLKPAVEVVIVAMKPIEEKTYIDQALSNKHGCTWLDDCRIPFNADIEPRKKWEEPSGTHLGYAGSNKDIHNVPITSRERNTTITDYTQKGRFPANVLCSDSVLNNGHITKSNGGTGIRTETNVFKGTEGHKHFNCGDEGGFSRYFSLDAWFAERIKLLPTEAQKTFPWLIVPKASKSEKNKGLEDMEDKELFTKGHGNQEDDDVIKRFRTVTKNNHPTCKPIKLMSWLITLASREGDIVLDPFCGCGTTLIAAKMLGRQYIGIEREEDYCEIARKRMAAMPIRLDRY